MLKIEKNIISERWNERMKTLSQEQVEQINAPLGKSRLLKLKSSKEAVCDGDVFVLSPRKDLYFYGKVLEANIQHIEINNWFTGCHVVFIFKSKNNQKDMSRYDADYNDILIGPCIVSNDYWKRGLFETIGNISLSNEEKLLDYGFFSMEPLGRWGTFYNADGTILDHIPKIVSYHGIKMLNGVYDALNTEIIIDPTLLDF